MTQWNGAPATAEQLEAMALSGYGSYTFFQSHGRAVHGLGLHLQRLRDNAQELFGEAPDEDLLRRLVSAAVTDEACSVRVTLVADHAAVLAGTPLMPDVAVTISDPRPQDPPPLSVRTTRYVRETPQVKHRGTHGLTRETRAARLAGFDDALLVGPDGNVTEGTTWNLLLHDGEGWVWPAAPKLHGVTAGLIQAAMDRSGAAHRTEPVDAHDVPAYAAAFALNSSVPGRVITAVDGHWLTGHPHAAGQLRQLWETVIPEPLA